jgi:putative transposase
VRDVESLRTYVHWYNDHRLHGGLEHLTPEEYEQVYYASPTGSLTR